MYFVGRVQKERKREKQICQQKKPKNDKMNIKSSFFSHSMQLPEIYIRFIELKLKQKKNQIEMTENTHQLLLR